LLRASRSVLTSALVTRHMSLVTSSARLSLGETRFGGGKHRLEARIVPDPIEVWINLGVVNKAGAHLLEGWGEHLQCSIPIFQMNRQRAAEIVSHRQVFGIDQQRPPHPFFGSFPLTQDRERIAAVPHG